eukprot:2100370-Prorocentrum_lima.AAC.1
MDDAGGCAAAFPDKVFSTLPQCEPEVLTGSAKSNPPFSSSASASSESLRVKCENNGDPSVQELGTH